MIAVLLPGVREGIRAYNLPTGVAEEEPAKRLEGGATALLWDHTGMAIVSLSSGYPAPALISQTPPPPRLVREQPVVATGRNGDKRIIA